MPLVIRGTRVPGTTMQVLSPGNVTYPAVSFANSQNTGMYLSAANTIGFSTGNAQSMTISSTSVDVAPSGVRRVLANATAVVANIPFASSISAPTLPLATSAYDLAVENLQGFNGSTVVAWGSASGATANGSYPILKAFSPELTDKYVSLSGTSNISGSFVTLGQTQWNIATNSGFTCVARVRFSSSNVTNNVDECIIDFGNDSNFDNIVICRNGSSGSVTFRVFTGTVFGALIATSPSTLITGNWQTIACRLSLIQYAPETWGMTIFNDGANVVTTTTAFAKDSLTNKTFAQSFIGRPYTPTTSNCYSNLDIQNIVFYDYPLSDTEITSMTTYINGKYTGLYSTFANTSTGSVSIGSTSPIIISASNDVSVVRSLNGLPLRGLRPWIAPNLLRYDVLNAVKGSRDAVYPMSPALDAVRTMTGNYPGSYAFFGAVLMTDRRLFLIPYNATAARIYDPASDTISVAGGAFPGSGACMGGVLLHDGRVLCLPAFSSFGIIYNPWTDSVSTTTSFAGSSFYAGGVVLNDGRVLLAPYNASRPAVYDPVLDTVTLIGSSISMIAGKYAGAVLLPSGKVYCVPHNYQYPLIFDPVTNTYTISTAKFPGNAAHWGGVLLPDGRIFNTPHNSTSARLYDPATDDVVAVDGFPGSYAFVGGCLLPCGRVACSPYQTNQVYIYDPTTNIVSRANGTVPTNNAHAGCVLLPDGRVYFTPCNGTQARVLNSSWGAIQIPPSVLTSPFYNKL